MTVLGGVAVSYEKGNPVIPTRRRPSTGATRRSPTSWMGPPQGERAPRAGPIQDPVLTLTPPTPSGAHIRLARVGLLARGARTGSWPGPPRGERAPTPTPPNPSGAHIRPGQWLQCQVNGSNVYRVLRLAHIRLARVGLLARGAWHPWSPFPLRRAHPGPGPHTPQARAA